MRHLSALTVIYNPKQPNSLKRPYRLALMPPFWASEGPPHPAGPPGHRPTPPPAAAALLCPARAPFCHWQRRPR
eukprot:scaffold551339_cov14-Prasinocladus_malaysianus.AAC.1